MWINPSPNTIQYAPLINAAFIRPPSIRWMIAADLVERFSNAVPANADPCFCQWIRSRDEAMPSRVRSWFHCV
ncbi:hypothetical protein D9M73_120020 [compost metagenome]